MRFRSGAISSPAEVGAQTALAHVAAQLGKRATIVVAKRAQPHARALEAKRLGAKVLQVSLGHLTLVQALARAYCEARGTRLVPFGVDLPEVSRRSPRRRGRQDWSRMRSGARPAPARWRAAWPQARRRVFQFGRHLVPHDLAGAEIIVYPRPFGATAATQAAVSERSAR